jgi:hypothetical protein
MSERLRTTAATVEAGNAATVTALDDLRAKLAEGRFSFNFTPARSRMLLQGWNPLLSQGQGRLSRRRRRPFGPDPLDATACLRAYGGRLACSAPAGVSWRTVAANSPRGVC